MSVHAQKNQRKKTSFIEKKKQMQKFGAQQQRKSYVLDYGIIVKYARIHSHSKGFGFFSHSSATKKKVEREKRHEANEKNDVKSMKDPSTILDAQQKIRIFWPDSSLQKYHRNISEQVQKSHAIPITKTGLKIMHSTKNKSFPFFFVAVGSFILLFRCNSVYIR